MHPKLSGPKETENTSTPNSESVVPPDNLRDWFTGQALIGCLAYSHYNESWDDYHTMEVMRTWRTSATRKPTPCLRPGRRAMADLKDATPRPDHKRSGLFNGTAIDYVRMRAAHHEINYGMKAQAEHLRKLADQNIAERDRLRAELTEATRLLRSAVSIAAEAHAEWDADNDSRVGKILIALSGGIPGYRKDTDEIRAFLSRQEKPNG